MTVYDPSTKLWCRKSLANGNETLWTGQHVLNMLALHSSKVAQINDATGVRLTFHDLWIKTVRAAQNLQKYGFKKGDVFGFMVDHTDHLVPILLAAMCMGCPAATLHPTLSKDEIVRSFLKAKPSAAFCVVSACNQLIEAVKELPFDVQMFIFDGRVDGFESVCSLFVETGEENRFVPVKIDPDVDAAAILCSSGTTGPSKSIRQPHSTLFKRMVSYPSGSIIYCADSIYWGVGFKPIFDSIQTNASRIITSKPYTPETPLQIIHKHKVTILLIAAFDLIACLKTDLIHKVKLTSVQKIATYGSKIPNNSIAGIHRHFPNAELESYYGMTEIGWISSTTYNKTGDIEYGGELAAGYIAKIVDDDGKRCGPNMSGELCIKKSNPFKGYIDDAETSATVFDAEGFYQTGDIAYFGENARLFVQDRKKNTLTLFYFDSILLPFELEECLIQMAGVKEVCVVGVPIAGGAALPAAVIVPKPGVNLKKREVFDKIAESFPKRSWLRAGVYFVESLSKTSNGKLVRREITRKAIKLFESAKQKDPEIRSYFSDIPEAFRKLI